MSSLLTLAIIIHFTNVAEAPPAVVRDAQAQVIIMFREVGVEVNWAAESPTASGDHEAVRLTLLPFETGALRGRGGAVLGAAVQRARGIGTAWVFYRRVAREAARHTMAVAPILACAIAHELAHLMQRVPGHTGSGVMRASWNRHDYVRAINGRLRFTPADAALFEPLPAARAADMSGPPR